MVWRIRKPRYNSRNGIWVISPCAGNWTVREAADYRAGGFIYYNWPFGPISDPAESASGITDTAFAIAQGEAARNLADERAWRITPSRRNLYGSSFIVHRI